MLSCQLQECETTSKIQDLQVSTTLPKIQKMSLLLQADLHHSGIALLGGAEEVAAEPFLETTSGSSFCTRQLRYFRQQL